MLRIDGFLTHLAGDRGFSDNTIAAYQSDLNQFVAFLDSPPAGLTIDPVSDIGGMRDEHLEAFATYIQDRDYAPSTVARKIAALKSFTTYLYRIEATDQPLGRSLTVPRVKKSQPKTISTHQVERLLQAPLLSGSSRPERVRDIAMLELLYASGMRVTELVTLNHDDISFDASTITLHGRRNTQRTLALPDRCGHSLRAWADEARPSVANRDEAALFVNHRGNRLTRQGFWLILKAYAERLDIEEITPHTLRHSFAAHAVDRGMGIKELQQRLGHVSSVTTQIYKQLRDEPNSSERENGSTSTTARDRVDAAEPVSVE